MKNNIGLFGIIALTAIIGFSATACRQPGSVPIVDMAALGSAIAGAQTLLAGTMASADGVGIASGYWASQTAIDTFSAAIATAQAVYGSNAATHAMVDAAVETLAAAQVAFIAARQPGTYTPATVNRTVLGNAIAAAQVLLAETETSADGDDVATTAYWATADAHSAFDNAINTAQAVYSNPTATQATVDAAVEVLATARTAFTAARQLGTSETAVDRTALAGAIAGARALLDATETSTDGTDILPTAYWTTAAVRTAFDNAVNTAQGVRNDTSATQTEVAAAIATLATAQGTFNTARQPGTYTPTPVDRTALAQALTAARTLLTQTETSPDGYDISATAYWTTAAVRTAFDNAVNTAQGVHDDNDATQAEVDTTVETLEAAQAAFYTARQPGRFPRGSFTIDFSPDMATNAQGPTVYLSYTGQPPVITLLNPDRFDTSSIRWLLGNGEPVPAAALTDNGATLILNRHVHGNRTGEHRVTAEAGIDGVPHGAVVDFTVEL